MAATVLAGIAIPSTSPVFIGGVALHVAVAIAAVATGAAAMLSRKGSRRHRRLGLAYFWCLLGGGADGDRPGDRPLG